MVALSVFIMATLAEVTFSKNTARSIPTFYIAREVLAK